MKIHKLHNGAVIQEINPNQIWYEHELDGIIMNITEPKTLKGLMVDEKTKQQITKILQENIKK